MFGEARAFLRLAALVIFSGTALATTALAVAMVAALALALALAGASSAWLFLALAFAFPSLPCVLLVRLPVLLRAPSALGVRRLVLGAL